jgi:hypothetical protein
MKNVQETAFKYAEKTVDQCTNVTVARLKEYAQLDFQEGIKYAQEFIPIKRDKDGFISKEQQFDFHTLKPIILMSRDSDLEIAYDLENELSERYTHWRPVFFL